ncbi:Na+/H+ antiporter NhaA [Gimibacter soli]|uniref:Na(+)/H(+) antiporter NhaA n=1 Tax=Gimibacter soli TaxID=3024400 RepID=A0AAE9XVC1_9PROT|nr:Na+/H+ antiporter NhaA [Gimibacter soli]WCL54468.1 Na+/H+ antiporter NhaA [Gimibacter soli]
MKSAAAFLQAFLKQEQTAGLLLMGAAVLAMIAANSPLAPAYGLLLDTPVAVQVGALAIHKPLLLWVNDGLMAVFFLLVGLELKREFVEGELADRRAIILPLLGAIGGMVVPAGLYAFFNWHDPVALQGWAIPAATDIAFALGILALFGSRVPLALKVFLTSLAIFDDLGAILIIAFFYTSQISLTALAVATLMVAVLFCLNRFGVMSRSLYFVAGAVMWIGLLKSGVHATLAGVVLAFFIPINNPADPEHSPLRDLEEDLHAAVAYVILPVFAFCNGGIAFAGLGLDALLHPIPVGIAAGLFVGKQLGIVAFCGLGILLGLAKLPEGSNRGSFYGVSVLAGVGFTMSLFIGSLAFEQAALDAIVDERLGIVVGSLASGLLGYLILALSLPKAAEKA